MSENLFSYAELESSKEVVVESKKSVTESYTPISTSGATSLQSFNYQSNSLDYGLLNGEPIFNLNAIAGLIGIANPRTSIDTTNNNYVIKVDNSIVGFAYNRKLHNTGELFLTEAGLYMLLMRSNNPNAEPFQLWVTKEVLPSIRKNGGYIAGQENLTDEQLLAKALLVAKNVIENKDKIIQAQKTTIADQKEIINSYKIADRTKRNKQELATLLNRKIRELADKQYNKQYAKCYNEVYADFAKLHCFTHKVDMQFLKTNIDYLSECLKLVLDKE